MYGGIYVLLYQSLRKKNCILVVVAFPGHESDQGVLTKCKLTLGGGRTICDNLSCLNVVTLEDNGLLVVAVGLVGTGELGQMILFRLTVIIIDGDHVRCNVINGTCLLSDNADTRVNGGLHLHASTYDGRLGKEQGHCLTLHVGSHQRTVRIVVLKERDEGRCNGEYHLRRHVHVVKHRLGISLGFLAITTGYHVTNEMSVLIQRLVCLCYVIIILLVSGHVDHLVRNAGILRVGLVNLTIRSLHEAIFIDPCIACKGVDQTDVRTFRGLNGAHSSVMGVMYVTHLESGTVTGQTARSQCGETSLMSQLTKRVILVHELGQLGGSEELLHCCSYGLDVDQILKGDLLSVMSGHAFAHHSLHSGKTDAVLVLKELTNGADTSVAKVIDVIILAKTPLQMHVIVDGRKDVLNGDVLGNQLVHVLLQGIAKLLGIIAELLEDLFEHGIINQFMNAEIIRVTLNKIGDVNHHVGKNLNVSLLRLDHYVGNCRILDLVSKLSRYLGASLGDHVTVDGIDNVLRKDLMTDTIAKGKLLVELVASNLCEIITAGIKEHRLDQAVRTLNAQRLAGTDLLIEFKKTFLIIGRGILLKTSLDLRLVAEKLNDLLVGTDAKGTDEDGDGNLSGTVHANVKDVIGIRLILQPCTAVRDHGTGKELLTQSVVGNAIINTGGTNKLANDDTLCTVDDKGTGCSHQRQVTHEDLVFHDLRLFLVDKETNLYF